MNGLDKKLFEALDKAFTTNDQGEVVFRVTEKTLGVDKVREQARLSNVQSYANKLLSYSNGEFSLNVIDENVFTPTSISDLYAWYRSDLGITLNGAYVSSWADQSGNGLHLSQASALKQPSFNLNDSQYNNLPSLSFSSSRSTVLTNSSFTYGPYTLFMVCKVTNSSWFYLKGSSPSQARDFLFSSGAPEVWAKRGTTTSSKNLTATLASSNPAILQQEFNGTHASHKLFKNGSELTLTDGATDDPGTTPSPSSKFALFSDDVDDFSTGTIAELLLFSRLLNNTEKTQINNYLNSRYSIY